MTPITLRDDEGLLIRPINSRHRRKLMVAALRKPEMDMPAMHELSAEWGATVNDIVEAMKQSGRDYDTVMDTYTNWLAKTARATKKAKAAAKTESVKKPKKVQSVRAGDRNLVFLHLAQPPLAGVA